jgi:predicted O-methyltransferase YrrM
LPSSLAIARPQSDVTSQVLVITGMHRSGTSLVSSLIQAAGVHVGENLISANVANPRGYFEDVDFYEFHERALHARGRSYLYADVENGDFEPTAEELSHAHLLVSERMHNRLWGWKDPRTALFLDFWRQLVPEARFLFVYRHPLDVLLSLLRRGEFDEHPNFAAGLRAWQAYNSRIASFYNEHRDDCLLVHIDPVVENVERFAALLQGKLGIAVQFSPDSFAQIFRANELKKTMLSLEGGEILDRLYPEVHDLYERLNACSDLRPNLSTPTNGQTVNPELSALATAIDSWPGTIGPAVRQSALQLFVSALAPDRADKAFRQFNSAAKGLQQRVDSIWLYAQQLERKTGELEQLLEIRERELSQERDAWTTQHPQLTSQIHAQLATINDLRGQVRTQQGQIDSQQSVVVQQRAQIATLASRVAERDLQMRQQSERIESMSAEISMLRATLIQKLFRVAGQVRERIRKPKAMSTKSYQGSLASPIQGSITERIAQVRELQAQLHSRPVTGSLRGLKKMVFQMIRSTFSRQFTLNSVTVDLIESIHRDLERLRPQLQSQHEELQHQSQRLSPASTNSEVISSGEVLASCGLTQDQAKVNNIRNLTGFNHVYTSPAEMRMPERVALYSLVFGLQPKNCLEIGTFRGGSTAIIFGAMEDTGFGQLTCVDPLPKVDPALWTQLSARCQMIEGPSPDILPEVSRRVGTPFDFALIDGNHTYDFVKRDIAAVLPLMADAAYLLFHDANYPDVKRAIDESVSEHTGLIDCGLISVEPTIFQDGDNITTWAGLRLLRFQRSKY